MIFARRLRDAREAMGYQQKHVALAIEVHYSTYSRWENPDDEAMPKLPNLKELAVNLRVSTDALLGLTRPVAAQAVSPEEMHILASVRALPEHDYQMFTLFLQRLLQGGRV